MMGYASRTGTRRNLAALRAAGWGLLVSRAGEWRTEGFGRYVLDSGAWADFQAGRSFDEYAFEQLVERLGARADWIVLPDIVAGGAASLALSTRWLNRCLSVCSLVLIAVQDGMQEADLAPLVGRSVGVFLGGSTEWKLANMLRWGAFCAERGVHYHVARVNTERRIWLAAAAGADSIDGSSATRYAVTLPMLDRAMKQQDLFA
ncbi:MAG TPA: hypothetical protein VGH84_11950 [Steroidobacteraceae bacterium]|jgi:hypothetical protein